MITIKASGGVLVRPGSDPIATLLGRKVVSINGSEADQLELYFEGGGSIVYESDRQEESTDRKIRTAAIQSIALSLSRMSAREETPTEPALRKPPAKTQQATAADNPWIEGEQLSLIDAADRVLSNFRTVEEVAFNELIVVRGTAWHVIHVLRGSVKELELAHRRALLDIAANEKEDQTS